MLAAQNHQPVQKIVELTQSQSLFVKDDESKAIAFVTGFGGGKTFSLVTKMVKIKLAHPKEDLLYLMPFYSMFRDVLFPTISEVLEGTGIGYKINKSTGEIFFEVGGRIILKSMDSPESIVGMNVLAVFLDELDTLPREKAWQVWIKALARARRKVEYTDVNGNLKVVMNQMIVGSTPEGFRLLYKLFVKEKPDNYTLIQASGKENIYLPDDYYANLYSIYPKELVEAYIDGKFVNMSIGTVYTEFDRQTCDSDALYRDGEELHISIDFNVQNMNAVVYVERDPVFTDNPLFIYEGHNSFHAVRHLKGAKDTPELIEMIKNRYPTSPIYVYPDASGRNTSSKGFTTSDISLLKSAGFHARYPNKNPRVMDRVQASNSAFKTGLICVNVKQCPDVADSLEQQVFNERTELPEKSASDSIDDVNDAATYFIHYKFPISKNKIKQKIIQGL